MARGGQTLFTRLSLIVRRGEMLYVRGSKDSGKSSLIEAVMGLMPVTDGYITMEGELLTTYSAATFRRLMAYVPQDLQLSEPTFAALFDRVVRLDVNRKSGLSKDTLWAFWSTVNIDRSYYDMPFDRVDEPMRRMLMLSLACVLRRPLVLVDESQHATEDVLLREMARQGSAVLVTGSRETGRGVYDKQITLET
ncbi:ATP-binding cassette domain-containing protein [Hoylesella enoeca]|nr:ATP-binding cassette domain-containing protein [Hoylesella enoeca]